MITNVRHKYTYVCALFKWGGGNHSVCALNTHTL